MTPGRTSGHPVTAAEDIAGLARRSSPHGRIMALSMMKDEGPYLLEWVAHHLAVGFTDILVYTNDCSDGTDEMLKRLEVLGLAHHRENRIPEGLRPQPSALNYAQDETLVAEADWLLVFDADEFVSVRHGDGGIDGLISAAKERGANGIVITWRIFGSGGLVDWSRDPVTEQYLQAAPPMWNKGWGVKTLFQFDPVHWKLGIHRPKIRNKWLGTDWPESVRWLNGSGRPMEDYFRFRGWRSIVRTVGYDWVQMNHYAVKSIDAYVMRRFRGNVNFKKDKYNTDYWALQDRNEVRDETMLRYSAERRRIFEALLRDPVLHQLHFAAVERLEAQLAEFKATPGYAELVAGLKAAGEVPITRVEAKPPRPRDPGKIAALMSDLEARGGGSRAAERAAPRPERNPAPVDLFVRGEVDMSSDPPMEWFANHSILLPGDPRVLTPQALQLVQEGKYQRNLARNLPGLLPRPSVVAFLGADCGFLPACLGRVHKGLRIVVLETRGPLRQTMLRVWDRNGVVVGRNLRLVDSFESAGLDRADVLVISDPAITPTSLREIARPSLAVLTGGLLSEVHPEFSGWRELFQAWGLTESLPLDPSTAHGFRRPPPDQ